MSEEKIDERTELDKWSDAFEEWVAIENYVEFLSEHNAGITRFIGGHYHGVMESDRLKWFCEMHNIDQLKLEEERRALLDEAREANEGK